MDTMAFHQHHRSLRLLLYFEYVELNLMLFVISNCWEWTNDSNWIYAHVFVLNILTEKNGKNCFMFFYTIFKYIQYNNTWIKIRCVFGKKLATFILIFSREKKIFHEFHIRVNKFFLFCLRYINSYETFLLLYGFDLY